MQKPGPSPLTLRGRILTNLAFVAFAFVMMAGISAVAVWLIQQLQWSRCATGTFLSGSGQFAMAAQVIPIFLASVGLAFLAVSWLRRQRRTERSYRHRRTRRRLVRFSVIVLSIMMPISIAASFSQFCLAGQEILYRPWPWTSLQRYSWQDVAAIETFCTRSSRGGWHGSFILTMRDGASFDIMAWPPSAARAYPEIVRALEGVPFAFSSKGVRRDCNNAYVDLLARRP